MRLLVLLLLAAASVAAVEYSICSTMLGCCNTNYGICMTTGGTTLSVFADPWCPGAHSVKTNWEYGAIAACLQPINGTCLTQHIDGAESKQQVTMQVLAVPTPTVGGYTITGNFKCMGAMVPIGCKSPPPLQGCFATCGSWRYYFGITANPFCGPNPAFSVGSAQGTDVICLVGAAPAGPFYQSFTGIYAQVDTFSVCAL